MTDEPLAMGQGPEPMSADIIWPRRVCWSLTAALLPVRSNGMRGGRIVLIVGDRMDCQMNHQCSRILLFLYFVFFFSFHGDSKDTTRFTTFFGVVFMWGPSSKEFMVRRQNLLKKRVQGSQNFFQLSIENLIFHSIVTKLSRKTLQKVLSKTCMGHLSYKGSRTE